MEKPTLTYDNNNQLTSVSDYIPGLGAMPEEDFSFDASGNRDSAGYTTGSDNQMIAAPSLSNTSNHYEYAYDHEGNTTDRYLKSGTLTLSHTVYTWDYRNRLAEVQDFTVSGTSSTLTHTAWYFYNAQDQRIGKALDNNGDGEAATFEAYVYDGHTLVLVLDDSDHPLVRYLTGSDNAALSPTGTHDNEFFAEESVGTGSGGSNQTRWLLTDHLGTIRDVVDNTGSLVNTITYSAFGNIVSQTDPSEAVRVGFTGYVHDSETSLDYAWYRYYNGEQGRFISVDPMGFGGGDTNQWIRC